MNTERKSHILWGWDLLRYYKIKLLIAIFADYKKEAIWDRKIEAKVQKEAEISKNERWTRRESIGTSQVDQLVRVLSWYVKVAGSIPVQGKYKNQPMNA